MAATAAQPVTAHRPGRVVVVGAINVDLIMRLPTLPAPSQTVLDGDLSRAEGGKEANQAVAAVRLGAQAHLVGAVGAADGSESVASPASEGVHVGAIDRVAGPTGRAIVLIDDAGENQIAVAPGANALLSAHHVREDLGDYASLTQMSWSCPSRSRRPRCGRALTPRPKRAASLS